MRLILNPNTPYPLESLKFILSLGGGGVGVYREMLPASPAMNRESFFATEYVVKAVIAILPMVTRHI